MASSPQCHSPPCHGISLWCCSSKVTVQGCSSSYSHLMSIRCGHVQSSVPTFHLLGPWGPWPRAIMSCPRCGHAAGLGLELGSLPGQEGEAHISLSKGSHDQRAPHNLSTGGFHLSVSVLWQRSSAQAGSWAHLLCREEERERDLKTGSAVTAPALPAPTIHSSLAFSSAASVRTQFLAITVWTKTLS